MFGEKNISCGDFIEIAFISGSIIEFYPTLTKTGSNFCYIQNCERKEC